MHHAIHSKSLPNLKSQTEFVDITNQCAIHVFYLFSLGKPPNKAKKTFPFFCNPTENFNFSESMEQKLLSFFQSDCVNDDVNQLVIIFNQTIDENTEYYEVKKRRKNYS